MVHDRDIVTSLQRFNRNHVTNQMEQLSVTLSDCEGLHETLLNHISWKI